MKIDQIPLDSETELENVLKRDPEQIEKGLRCIATQVKTPPSDRRIDMLCVDGQNKLVVVEIKLDNDEHQMEQAILYYDWAISNLDWVKNAYPKYKIEDANPRILLIAKRFPDRVVTLAKYFQGYAENVTLMNYVAFKLGTEKHVICTEYILPNIPTLPEKPKTPEEILSYISDKKIRDTANKMRELIVSLDNDIEETPTKGALSYKYNGRVICYLYPRKEYFNMGWRSESGDWRTQTNMVNVDQSNKFI